MFNQSHTTYRQYIRATTHIIEKTNVMSYSSLGACMSLLVSYYCHHLNFCYTQHCNYKLNLYSLQNIISPFFILQKLIADPELSGHLNYSFISLGRFLSNHIFAISIKEQFFLKKNISPDSEMCMKYLYYGIYKYESEIVL